MAYRGQTAVIVGGTGGIGYAIARQLLIEKTAVRQKKTSSKTRIWFPIWTKISSHSLPNLKNVILVDVCDNNGNSIELQTDFVHQNVILLIADVTNRNSIERAFNEVIQKFSFIDLLINSAGLMKEKDAEITLNTNVVSNVPQASFYKTWKQVALI